jgi:hypothetical protein
MTARAVLQYARCIEKSLTNSGRITARDAQRSGENGRKDCELGLSLLFITNRVIAVVRLRALPLSIFDQYCPVRARLDLSEI